MPSRSRLPCVERRAQLVAAAASAFLARGFDGTSMDDVAQEAGVSRLIVYRNFDSKNVLYRSVLDSVLLDLAEAFAAVNLEEVRRAGRRPPGASRRPPAPRRVPAALAARVA